MRPPHNTLPERRSLVSRHGHFDLAARVSVAWPLSQQPLAMRNERLRHSLWLATRHGPRICIEMRTARQHSQPRANLCGPLLTRQCEPLFRLDDFRAPM